MSKSIPVRTIFVSDLHLGSSGFQAPAFLEFLKAYKCEKLVLVGDVFDFWAMKRRMHWPQSHSNVIQKILKLAKGGVKIVYIPGNHDEGIRSYLDLTLGHNITIEDVHEHETADGRMMVCLHGDQFDVIIQNHKILTSIGDFGYNLSMKLNPLVKKLRQLWGKRNPWSLSGYLKVKVKERIKIMTRFEDSLSGFARQGGYDGVVCGHTHIPEILEKGEVTYYNTGDWVDSCTALLEDKTGKLTLFRWQD